MENGIAEAILPQTFRDAIELSRHLGIPYLWIDALCICQDDPDEWAHEAATMKDVYVGSMLTIAASNGTCSDDGCFTAMAPSDPYSRDIQFSVRHADGHSFYIRAQYGDARSLASETSLSSRGWVLQEEILSKRVVYCMLPELQWRCRCCLRMESGPVFDKGESNALPLLSGQVKADLHDTWYQWMGDYSERKFTFERDKLSAMAGIVELFSSVSGDRHILGCWEESFARGLLWLPSTQLPSKPGIPGIPSWSWLTRYDKVRYHVWTDIYKDFAQEFHVELLDWDVAWAGTPLVSNVTAAHVRIRGPVQEVVLSVAPEARDYNPPHLNIGDEAPNITNGLMPWRCSGQIDDGGDTRQSYTCLLVWSASQAEKGSEIVLLLRPVISNDSTAATYQRVGIANFRDEKLQFTNKKYQDITLI
ncbi:hypothetical protein G7054_g4140 [Neopestalotiopsis clavispora]|nr:hypothetical protein G7054_g4140 [Neopestalotiopsis clavispora]